MNEAFDLRLQNDREALSELLPDIDGRTFTISKKEFIDALADLAFFLKNPDWMIYQWGSFLPIPVSKTGKFHLNLVGAIELGIAFRRLSGCTNFNDVLEGFFNPSQFLDARFEIRAALFFLSLPSTNEIVFSPEYEIRGHLKRPDFDVIMKDRTITVECKSPNFFFSKAINRIKQITESFKNAMNSVSWPENLRLEVNIIGPIREQLSSFANKIIQRALLLKKDEEELVDTTINAVVIRRNSPFRITGLGFWQDIMIVGKTPIGLLNPEKTFLRVASSRIDNQMSTHIGNCLNGALKQLPLTNNCLILIEEVPFSIAKIACERRLSDPAYSHIQAIGVFYTDELKFIHRKTDENIIKELNLI